MYKPTLANKQIKKRKKNIKTTDILRFAMLPDNSFVQPRMSSAWEQLISSVAVRGYQQTSFQTLPIIQFCKTYLHRYFSKVIQALAIKPEKTPILHMKMKILIFISNGTFS